MDWTTDRRKKERKNRIFTLEKGFKRKIDGNFSEKESIVRFSFVQKKISFSQISFSLAQKKEKARSESEVEQ